MGGVATAINLDNGQRRWRVVLGDTPALRNHPLLKGKSLPPLGVAGVPSRGFSRLSLEDDDDLVLRQIGDRQLLMQAASRTRSVTPPAVGTTAYDVCAVDDQNVHQASLRICPAPLVS